MDFKNIFTYTKALSENNTRPWFHENHSRYEKAREDFIQILEAMRFVIMESSPLLGDEIMLTPAKSFMYRIPRDMRYSKGKPPYNPAFRAYFSPNKKEFLPFGYFFYASFERVSIATGFWPWESEQIRKFREYVLETWDKLTEIVVSCGLEVTGDRLKGMPRGYPDDHPSADWLKYKSMFVNYSFSEDETADPDLFLNSLGREIRRQEPLRQYLSAPFAAKQTGIRDFYDIY